MYNDIPLFAANWFAGHVRQGGYGATHAEVEAFRDALAHRIRAQLSRGETGMRYGFDYPNQPTLEMVALVDMLPPLARPLKTYMYVYTDRIEVRRGRADWQTLTPKGDE